MRRARQKSKINYNILLNIRLSIEKPDIFLYYVFGGNTMKKKIFAIFLALRSLTLFVRCSKKAPEKGIFLKVNGDGVYRISIGTDSFESNIINADSSVIKKG